VARAPPRGIPDRVAGRRLGRVSATRGFANGVKRALPSLPRKFQALRDAEAAPLSSASRLLRKRAAEWTTGFRSRSLRSSPSREDLASVVLGRQSRQGRVGPRPSDRRRSAGRRRHRDRGRRDSLPTPWRSVALGWHASIPRLRLHLL